MKIVYVVILTLAMAWLGIWAGREAWTGQSYPLPDTKPQPVYYPRVPPSSAITP